MKQGRQTVDTRRSRILSMIREREKIRVEELAALFHVSLMTIRRDLQALEAQGLIGRFYGGASVDPYAVALSGKGTVSDCRRAISRRAAQFVENGDRLFINGSSTALDMLDYVNREDVEVFTNNGLAINRAFPSGVEVTLSGGSLRSQGHIMTGDCAMRNLLMMRAEKAFIGCSGISPVGEILCDIPTELGINETMISHAYQYYILADHTKVGKAGTYASFSLETPGTIITDDQAPASVLNQLRSLGMKVIQAGLEEE